MSDASFSNSGQAFEADLNRINLPDGVPDEEDGEEEEREEN